MPEILRPLIEEFGEKAVAKVWLEVVGNPCWLLPNTQEMLEVYQVLQSRKGK